MSTDFDVIIVGSGPAGVSVAFPLVEIGLKTLLVDGGIDLEQNLPPDSYLVSRRGDPEQWKWLLGRQFEPLRQHAAVSPKLRVPAHAPIFAGFEEANRIEAEGFIAIGSLSTGGLANSWGCGVARLSEAEMRAFPVSFDEMTPSYEAVSRRMGISGANTDDLSTYFGVDAWSDPPIQMDAVQSRLLANYQRRKRRGGGRVSIGRSRIAVLSRNKKERQACGLHNACLWGCRRGAIYTGSSDLDLLKTSRHFTHVRGAIVERIERGQDGPAVVGRTRDGGPIHLTAAAIVLAAGTLASSRLTFQALDLRDSRPLLHSPVAGFLLWLPAEFGQAADDVLGLGQLSYKIELAQGVTGFGTFFNPMGIPMSEYLRYMPFRRRFGIDVLKHLLPSCIVGNLFLPGNLSNSEIALTSDDKLKITGAYSENLPGVMAEAKQILGRALARLGALMVPRSFIVSPPGSDIHYAGSLPMRADPTRGELSRTGEVHGFDRLYIADASGLPELSSKSHTLTMMANADRIGRHIATAFKSGQSLVSRRGN